MLSAPTIAIYETGFDRGFRKIEDLLDPGEFFALGRSLSCALADFRLQADGAVYSPAELFADYLALHAPAHTRLDAAFARYCEACAAHALVMGRHDWRARPDDFDPDVRRFLSAFIQGRGMIGREYGAGVIRQILRAFTRILEDYRVMLDGVVDEVLWNEPYDSAWEMVHGPFQAQTPSWHRRFDLATCVTALDKIDQLDQYLTLAVNKGCEFSFFAPESPLDRTIDIGRLTLGLGRDGSVYFKTRWRIDPPGNRR